MLSNAHYFQLFDALVPLRLLDYDETWRGLLYGFTVDGRPTYAIEVYRDLSAGWQYHDSWVLLEEQCYVATCSYPTYTDSNEALQQWYPKFMAVRDYQVSPRRQQAYLTWQRQGGYLLTRQRRSA